MSAKPRNYVAAWLACILTVSAMSLRADQLQMQNGDRYAGKVLSVTSDSVVLQSDVLGKVTLPRNKISVLTFGDSASTNAAPTNTTTVAAAPVASPNSATTNADIAAALGKLGGNTNFIQQVRQQMLTGSPQATEKYNELVTGLMTGKLNVSDIRNEAKASIDRINELKAELGPEAGDSLDGYLTILQSFVNETAPTEAATPAIPPANPPANSSADGLQPFRDPKMTNSP
jgi:hypothetical protein